MVICRVCESEMEIETDKCCTIPSCGHEFHTDCIITWLCENYGKCCQCEHDSQLQYQAYRNSIRPIYYRDFRYASAQARRKTASRALKTMYTKYVRLSIQYNEHRQKTRLFKTERMRTYKTLRTEYYNLRRQLRKSHRRVRGIRREICSQFPIPEEDMDSDNPISRFTELQPPSFCNNEPIIVHRN
jgi:hypothetical protein